MRYAARLASALDARVVMPDYPLAPEHTWRDSHEAWSRVIERRLATRPDGVVLVGDSAGGGLALARGADRPRPRRAAAEPPAAALAVGRPHHQHAGDRRGRRSSDPWLFIGKLYAYASWWAGSDEDLGRPEVSPALADLSGLPPALMFSGTRDTLMPGCRLLARRAAEAGWDLTYVEEPGLLHVYPILPFIPEARQAWRTTVEFLRSDDQ